MDDELGGFTIPLEISQPLLRRLQEEGCVRASWTIGEKVREANESWDDLLSALAEGKVLDRHRELIFGKEKDVNNTLLGYPVVEVEMPEAEREKWANIQFGLPLVAPPPNTVRSRLRMWWRVIKCVLWARRFGIR